MQGNCAGGQLRTYSEIFVSFSEKVEFFFTLALSKRIFPELEMCLRRRMQSGVAGYALHGEFYTRVGRRRGRKNR